MNASALFLLTIGGILLLGLLTSAIARHSFLPRVTLLLILGAAIGPDFLNLIPPFVTERFELIADITLLLVGFLLGGRLTPDMLRESAGDVFFIATSAALLTTVVVSATLLAFGVQPQIAIVLGCIAAATAPAAVFDVVTEEGRSTRFSRLLLGIVAFDDVLALILFGIGLSLVKTMNGYASDTFFLWVALRELGGALLLGFALGLPAAFLTGRVKPGQPILSEALGLVLVCGGLAIYFEVSHLIAAMAMGATIANLAQHHEYPFHAIEGLEPPLLVVFFILAGASLEITALLSIGAVAVAYVMSRTAGKIAGGFLGASAGHTDTATRKWIGPALLPQAGVSIGMALVAADQFPEYRQVLLPVVISSTVLFEIVGPVFTRIAIRRTA